MKILKHGEALLEVLKQGQYNPYPLHKEVFYLYLAKNEFLDNIAKGKISMFLEKAYEYMQNKHPGVLKAIEEEKEISDKSNKELEKGMEEFVSLYKEEY